MSVDLSNRIWKYFKVTAQWYHLFKSVIKSLLSLIVKPSIIVKSKTATDLKNNLSSEENLLPTRDAEMGFGAKKVWKELIKKDVTAKDIRRFCEKSRSVFCGILIKLFEQSPILCKMVRFTSLFNLAVFLVLAEPYLGFESNFSFFSILFWVLGATFVCKATRHYV